MSSTNVCHAVGCSAPIGQKALMCRDHWFMIPKGLRDKLWAELYSCPAGKATQSYLAAAKECITFVAHQERGQYEGL